MRIAVIDVDVAGRSFKTITAQARETVPAVDARASVSTGIGIARMDGCCNVSTRIEELYMDIST
jgi:hypothetical protein